MDIDTGDSPPVSSRPYTLVLKHHRWVQEEIETLKRAGVITKSMSPWASPIVMVPKKSQPGEPPKSRLCIDFRKINDLQQKVITEGKSKGCLSLIPLPKIDEMYTKLKGAKYPPKVVKKPPFRQITRNLLTIFRFGPREMETSNFTVNCTKSAQFANPPSVKPCCKTYESDCTVG